MRELRQEEFQIKSAIQNVLATFMADFRSRITPDQIDRMATRLTIWGFSARKIDVAMELITGQADEKFPTPLQIKQAINGKEKTEKEQAPRDPQVDKDREKYKRHLGQFEKALGKELLDQYIDVWHKEFFKGADTGIFTTIVPTKVFNQLAIADLARANGNARRAIEMIRAEKSRQVDTTVSDFYESETYRCYRAGTVRNTKFVIKGAQ